LVKLDKIYTRGGDSGLTSLGDGKRVEKHSLRIRAYGEVDEVNSILGIVVCYCNEFLKKIILKIQNDLFDIGADLCIPSLKEKKIALNEKNILFLEKELDEINDKLKKLDSFILPGGTKASSFLHYARTVTRRCERTIVELSSKEKINQNIIKYINRLSDFLFVAARIENIKDGDILWIPNKT
jgi:cob(I)alamin adenosyltransferase